MSTSREIRWKIDAFTAETMPLDRLLEYLGQLAIVLGDPEHVHLIKVDTSSTVPVLRIDEVAIERVRRRGLEVRAGIAPRETMEAYRSINRMLTHDKGTATLFEGEAEIIPFPGQEDAPAAISGVKQQGSLDGLLQKVGGSGNWVPVQLRTMDETTVSGCYAKRALAKQLGLHLFEPIRLYGRGRWTRTPDGQWVLDKFWIDTFDKLADDTLPNVMASLRSVKTTWIDNPIRDILSDEDDQ